METVHITASREYDVHLGAQLLPRVGELFKAAVGEGRRVALIAGERVMALYGERVRAYLCAAGYEVHCMSCPGGEKNKTLATYEQILRFLSERRFERSDVLAALGGGTTGDVAGFAAATYRRGMRLVQLPTTLLAAVDSSVGGKTAVNLDAGKNQVGCFYQPELVVCDTSVFATLPEREVKSGMGEVIKYGMLADEALFAMLERADATLPDERVIARCVEIKGGFVAGDEFDTGRRMLLNFGHTVGHAIEKCSDYILPHGCAVAAGMAIVTRAAATRGICPAKTARRLEKLLGKYALPTAADYSAVQLCAAALSDKKLSGGRLNLIVPERVGGCRIENIAPSELGAWLADGGVL